MQRLCVSQTPLIHEVDPMSTAHKTSRALIYEVEPMSIVLKPSTALRRRCQHAAPVCVTDTPCLLGRADVKRAQAIDGAVSVQRLCVSPTHLIYEVAASGGLSEPKPKVDRA